MSKIIKKSFDVILATALSGLAAVATADDTDIINFEDPLGSNVLFIMDVSGSMGTAMPQGQQSRIQVLQSALRNVLNSPDLIGTGIKVGLSSFQNGSAGGISYPVTPLTDTAASTLNLNSLWNHQSSIVNGNTITSYLPVAAGRTSIGYMGNVIPAGWTPGGSTPLVDALYEAALYFRGADVLYGRSDPSARSSAHPSTYTGLLYNSTTNGLQGTASYNSPIENECQSNSIILLSDGIANGNASSALIKTLMGDPTSTCPASTNPNELCGPELTNFLANSDNSGVNGQQTITTHTVGLALANNTTGNAARAYLQLLASNGNGQYFNATSSASLVTALLDALTRASRARSFASPTYTTSSDSLSNGNDVYIPVFDRGRGSLWSGNLKKYTRSGGRLVDFNGVNATDSLGGLKSDARDLWSTTVSVNAVESGGVANQLPAPDSRLLYTDSGVSGVDTTFSAANELKATNTNITKALLGDAGMTDDHRAELLSFIRGKESDGTTSRNHIGDIMHSKPVYVKYENTKRLYVGTNEGYLHSFDEATGVEEFAFMPSTLLKNIEPQFKNSSLVEHPYGVDGPITLDHNDINGDGIVNGAETAVLYFGLRRGGKAYYALDVTNPLAPPVLKWKIEQGSGDFNKLGYSWSQPAVMKMKHDKSAPAETVVVFGGGYVDDNAGEADNSGAGADVFIVKASDGSLVWKLSDNTKTELTNGGVDVEYAVPGNIRVMDMTGNNVLDRLYFGDTGGNVWRVDFESNLTGANSEKAKLKRFAELGGAAPKRKFFTEPDVAIFKAKGQYLISVAIGSGERPKPLDGSIDDNFFLLFDKDVRTVPTSTTPTITKAILKDATLGPVTGVLSGGYRGWFMDLVVNASEKVVSRATIYNNKILFNTLGITDENSVPSQACGAKNRSLSRLYVVDIMDAGGVVDLNNDSTINPADENDRSTPIAEGEIPGAPHIVKDVSATCIQGDCLIKDSIGSGKAPNMELEDSRMLRRVYWIDKE